MSLPKRYDPSLSEPRWQSYWQTQGVYRFAAEAAGEVYAIDTPPATVSGHLHLGHVYSYSHTDFMARFWRMQGKNVFYPMGFDDNGLPTERLVEKRLQIRAVDLGRQAFIEKCLQVSEEAELDYKALWQRLGLSIDWRHTYRTIDRRARQIAQWSFLDLYHKGLAYHREAPAIWCPECQTSIAQAELNDLERESEFVTLAFRLENGETLPVATTRPELLPACVAVFVHPEDVRFSGLPGKRVQTPLFGQWVPVLADPGADPQKGTGAVMCCTFGDTADVAWQRLHNLPTIMVVERDGCLSDLAGEFAGLPLAEARKRIKESLASQDLIMARQPTLQSIRVHERCDTPVEYILVRQWFVKVLEYKEQLIELGEKIAWRPANMQARYRAWVENLNWDWCISRQRYYGAPFPLWYCRDCGAVLPASVECLPVDPLVDAPASACSQCGGREFIPEADVMDTWATSSLSPQIAGGWQPGLAEQPLYDRLTPYSLRPQAHEIIRTWAFYTIVKSYFHFGSLPWHNVGISGWGIAGEGMGKISKSRGGGPMPPLEMIERYSADAVRYWAASTGPGKDAVISEEKIQIGARLVTKLWNVARFCERFIEEYRAMAPEAQEIPPLSPADGWILGRLQRLVHRATGLLCEYDYAAAKSEIEVFFWNELTDNYLEMCKQRLYAGAADNNFRSGALYTLDVLLQVILKLFAPFLPYVTEEIYQGLYAGEAGGISIHRTPWPQPDICLEDEAIEQTGALLVEIATAVRRFKSRHNFPLGMELSRLQLATGDGALQIFLDTSRADLASITRARQIEIVPELDPALEEEITASGMQIAILVDHELE